MSPKRDPLISCFGEVSLTVGPPLCEEDAESS